MTSSNGSPRSLGAFLLLLVALIGWGVVDSLVIQGVHIAMETGGDFGPIERAITSADNWVLRWLPFALFPVLLAPEAAVVVWAVQGRRQTPVPGIGSLARVHLRIWAMALVGALGLGVVAALLWKTPFFTNVGITALFAFSWSYAGAVFAALRLQKHRNMAGVSGVKASSMAIAVFLLASCAPISFVGAIVPLWILWASRGDITPQAQQAG